MATWRHAEGPIDSSMGEMGEMGEMEEMTEAASLPQGAALAPSPDTAADSSEEASQASPTTTRDSLLGGRVSLIQPAQGYRAAIDPVLLAAFLRGGLREPGCPRQPVLDAGAGVGAASLCLAAACPETRITGLELQPELVRLAEVNCRLNGVQERVRMLEGDILAPPPALAPGGFGYVMVNPPYLAQGQATPPPQSGRAKAHVEAADLKAWLRFCLDCLSPKGTLVLIHRADRLDHILSLLRRQAGEIVILPLWPKPGQAAKRILLRARKGVRSPLTLLPGLVLHDSDGAYSAAAEAILRGGAALEETCFSLALP